MKISCLLIKRGGEKWKETSLCMCACVRVCVCVVHVHAYAWGDVGIGEMQAEKGKFGLLMFSLCDLTFCGLFL
jgi:hypothetical protein